MQFGTRILYKKKLSDMNEFVAVSSVYEFPNFCIDFAVPLIVSLVKIGVLKATLHLRIRINFCPVSCFSSDLDYSFRWRRYLLTYLLTS